jgi:hypothetical protein
MTLHRLEPADFGKARAVFEQMGHSLAIESRAHRRSITFPLHQTLEYDHARNIVMLLNLSLAFKKLHKFLIWCLDLVPFWRYLA